MQDLLVAEFLLRNVISQEKLKFSLVQDLGIQEVSEAEQLEVLFVEARIPPLQILNHLCVQVEFRLESEGNSFFVAKLFIWENLHHFDCLFIFVGGNQAGKVVSRGLGSVLSCLLH